MPSRYKTTASPKAIVNTLYQNASFHRLKAIPSSKDTINAFEITGNMAAIGIFLMKHIGMIAIMVASVPKTISYHPRLEVVFDMKQPKMSAKENLGFNTTRSIKTSDILN